MIMRSDKYSAMNTFWILNSFLMQSGALVSGSFSPCCPGQRDAATESPAGPRENN